MNFFRLLVLAAMEVQINGTEASMIGSISVIVRQKLWSGCKMSRLVSGVHHSSVKRKAPADFHLQNVYQYVHHLRTDFQLM